MPITAPGQTGSHITQTVESIDLGSGIFAWIYVTADASLPVMSMNPGGHFFVAADIGKPLSDFTYGEVYDNESSESNFLGIITRVISPVQVEYAPPGSLTTIPRALLWDEGSWAVQDPSHGRYVDWDNALGLYVPYPSAAASDLSTQIFFINLNSSPLNVTVLGGDT